MQQADLLPVDPTYFDTAPASVPELHLMATVIHQAL